MEHLTIPRDAYMGIYTKLKALRDRLDGTPHWDTLHDLLEELNARLHYSPFPAPETVLKTPSELSLAYLQPLASLADTNGLSFAGVIADENPANWGEGVLQGVYSTVTSCPTHHGERTPTLPQALATLTDKLQGRRSVVRDHELSSYGEGFNTDIEVTLQAGPDVLRVAITNVDWGIGGEALTGLSGEVLRDVLAEQFKSNEIPFDGPDGGCLVFLNETTDEGLLQMVTDARITRHEPIPRGRACVS